MKILVADHDRQYARWLETELSQRGHDVVYVEDGLRAQSSVESDEYHLVISDLLLAGLDGAELLTWMNSLTSKPIFALLSSYCNESIERYFTRLGARTVSQKPNAADRLTDILAELETKRSGAHQMHTESEPAPVSPPPVDEAPSHHAVIPALEELIESTPGALVAYLTDVPTGACSARAVSATASHGESFADFIPEKPMVPLFRALFEALNTSEGVEDVFVESTGHFHAAKVLDGDQCLYVLIEKTSSNFGMARLALSTIEPKDIQGARA